ncbi:hypothetical protein BCR32DRAFT_290781 [Anaeromyces robustus]|uniref:RRM domain-containing protein n=1 Tax=Anaeromyces robustus TaxID=1754192 RepID=A0A1Y1XHK6_9FUNG|nr:hypothetical protein BCR32DRAFT_290781 [Anaeromyces robustus]|eukprot:ORX85225.1 hypothetical protein BCR32DRAFT_290781 [Anaeromyces robustus]
MSEITKQNESFSVAADALIGNVLQEEPASFINNNDNKADSTKKINLKNQKPIKMKNLNEPDEKIGNVASAAENAPLYGTNANQNESTIANTTGNTINNNTNSNNNNNNSGTTTPLNSSSYFGNRSNPNINGAKKIFEKRYNSISFSPNVNLHSSILNSSPILVPKKTLHVTNFTMNKCALRNLLLSFPGFKTVAFYQDYCFVVFADIESATSAAEQLLAKTKLKVNFSKNDYVPNVVSPSSIGNPNSILHVTNYPTSTTETEMIEMYSSYPGYLHIHFSKNFSLVYYQDIASAKNVLQHMNQTTNFTTIYSIKNANNSPINMNNNYHNNVPNGPPPFNPMMNNGYRNMNVNSGLVMANGYPQPPVSATAPTTSNFNANGLINHPHNNSVNVSPNSNHNNSFIKYNSSNTNLAGMANNTNNMNNNKALNNFTLPPNAAAGAYGFNNANTTINNGNNMTNGPLKVNNNNMPNAVNNGMNYFGNQMSKPMTLSPNFGNVKVSMSSNNVDGDNNDAKNFSNPYKNPNNMTRKQSEGADLSSQFLNLNISRNIMNNGQDNDNPNTINDMIKNSMIQSKSDSNLNGLLNHKDIDNTSSNLNSNVTSPFIKKGSIYDDMNGLKSTNSSQLLSAGNYGMDRNDFVNTTRKFSSASTILMENNQNSNIGMINSVFDNNNNKSNNNNGNNYTNYPNNNKFMMSPDTSFSRDYPNVMKGNNYNSVLPMQNYNNYNAQPSQKTMPGKEGSLNLNSNISDPMTNNDMFNQMNYSDMNDPNTLFNNLSRTLSDSAISQNNMFEGDTDIGNKSMTLNGPSKIPSIQLTNSTTDLNRANNIPQNSSTTSAFNITNVNKDKIPFMPLTMSGHGSGLSSTNTDSLRATLKQNSLSSIDLMSMNNLYSGPINSSTFSHPLLKATKNELSFIQQPGLYTNSSSPYNTGNNNTSNGNILSSGMANTSFSSLNGYPSIMNKSRSFCAINSLNNISNKNPNDLSFTSIFSSDKKDNNTSLDGNISIIKNGYGVESPKSMYEPVLKNLKLDDFELDGELEKGNKLVGVIGESTKANEKINDNNNNNNNNESLDIDYIKVDNNISSKDISSSYSDSSVNENDFIEFIASKRPETNEENSKPDDSNNKLEAKDKDIKNLSISSSTSPTIIYSPIYNDKNELSIDEVIFNGNNNNNINGHNSNKIPSSSSSSTQINTNVNDSFLNSTKNLSPIGHNDNTTNKKLQNDIEEGKLNDDLIKQLYSKIEQLQKENNELSQTRNYHLMLISKLEDQLEHSRSENNNLKEQLNRLS